MYVLLTDLVIFVGEFLVVERYLIFRIYHLLFGFAAGFIARSTGKLGFFSFILKGHLSQFLKTGFKPSGSG
jgi:hypothetical protein